MNRVGVCVCVQLCLADMWKLDLKKLDQWQCLREFSVDEAVSKQLYCSWTNLVSQEVG